MTKEKPPLLIDDSPQLIKRISEYVQGRKVDLFASYAEEIRGKLAKEEINTFIKFLETCLRYWNKKDFKVDENVADLMYAQFITLGRLACLCVPRLCPCRDFIENDKCICKVFVKQKQK